MTERKPKSSEAWWINIVGHDKPRIAHYRGPDHDIPAYWQYMEREVDVEDITPLMPVLPYALQWVTVVALEAITTACEKDWSISSDFDLNDDTAGNWLEGNTALQFGHIRIAKATLAKIEAISS